MPPPVATNASVWPWRCCTAGAVKIGWSPPGERQDLQLPPSRRPAVPLTPRSSRRRTGAAARRPCRPGAGAAWRCRRSARAAARASWSRGRRLVPRAASGSAACSGAQEAAAPGVSSSTESPQSRGRRTARCSRSRNTRWLTGSTTAPARPQIAESEAGQLAASMIAAPVGAERVEHVPTRPLVRSIETHLALVGRRVADVAARGHEHVAAVEVQRRGDLLVRGVAGHRRRPARPSAPRCRCPRAACGCGRPARRRRRSARAGRRPGVAVVICAVPASCE